MYHTTAQLIAQLTTGNVIVDMDDEVVEIDRLTRTRDVAFLGGVLRNGDAWTMEVRQADMDEPMWDIKTKSDVNWPW